MTPSKSKSTTQGPIRLSDLIGNHPDRGRNGGLIDRIPLDPSPSSPSKKKTSYPIPGHKHLRKFIQTSKEVFSDLSRRGLISSKESKTFDHHLRWIWTYYDELNSRWSNIRGGIKEDGLRQNILKVIGRWSSNLDDHMEFLDDTRSLIRNLYHSGEMSEDDLEMVKMEIDQFQSIVLTLRKKVQDVKGY